MGVADPVWRPLKVSSSFRGGPGGGAGAAQEPPEFRDADAAVQLSFSPAETSVHVLQPGWNLLICEVTGPDQRRDHPYLRVKVLQRQVISQETLASSSLQLLLLSCSQRGT